VSWESWGGTPSIEEHLMGMVAPPGRSAKVIEEPPLTVRVLRGVRGPAGDLVAGEEAQLAARDARLLAGMGAAELIDAAPSRPRPRPPRPRKRTAKRAPPPVTEETTVGELRARGASIPDEVADTEPAARYVR
jgi:hypothetical protein